MGVLGGASLAALSSGAASDAVAAGAPPRIDTPEERAEYTKRLLKELCTDLGPRPAGSKACITGGKIIKREMERSLPQVELDWFTFTKWELTGKPEFSLGWQSIETYPSYGGPGTPPTGILGILKKIGETGFVLADAASGQTIANLIINSIGRANSHYQDPDKPGLPTFILGKQDIPLLERAVRLKLPVFAKSSSRLRPNTRSCSVIGRLPGKVSDEMFIVAHSDTEYDSPGANDNTASVIVMILLAHAAAAMKPDWTLTFMAADAEEYAYHGAKHYAARREADGTMKNIRIALNFDSLTYGPNLQVTGKDEALKQVIRDIYRDLAIGTEPTYSDSDGYIFDGEPFRSSGGKGLFLNGHGYEEKMLPTYHRPDDVPMSVPLDCVETPFLVIREFIRRMGKA
jgi:hypothetical protein